MKPLLAVLVPVMALCAVFAVFHLGAQPAIPAPVVNQQLSTFGMVGLASGQTARLNAFVLPMGGTVMGTVIPAGTCQVTLTFYDATGASLGSSGAVSVAPGSAVHFDWPHPATTSTTTPPEPLEIRGTVSTSFSTPTATPTTVPIAAFCSVVPTEEIYNSSSGQVTAVLELSHALATVLPL